MAGYNIIICNILLPIAYIYVYIMMFLERSIYIYICKFFIHDPCKPRVSLTRCRTNKIITHGFALPPRHEATNYFGKNVPNPHQL